MLIEQFLTYNITYLIFALPCSVLIYLVFKLSYKDFRVSILDKLILLCPGVLYTIIDQTRLSEKYLFGKTLANTFAELPLIGVLCSVLFLIKLILENKKTKSAFSLSVLYLIASCFVILIVYLFTPCLPE